MARRDNFPPGRVGALASTGIFLVALIPRLLHVREIHQAGLADFLRLDPLYYQEWALRILAGEWIGHDVFEMSPLYSYSLAVLYKFSGVSLLTPRVIQAFLGAGTCVLVFLLGSKIFGRGIGLMAGLALALYGPGIFYDGQINKTTLAMALTLAFSGALWISGGRHMAWLATGGLALGLAALVHENVNVAAPILLAWILFARHEDPWIPRLKRAAIFMAGYAIAVIPATAHNIAGAGEYVLITSAGGENFYTGNNENASGRYAPPPFVRPDPFYEHEDFRLEAGRRLGRELTRKEASSFWWKEGFRFISSHPGRFIWLIWDKTNVFLNNFERPDNFSYYNFRVFSPTLNLPWLSFGLIFPLSLLGIAASAGRWRELLPLYAGIGAYLASAIIFFIQSRYRMPALPLLILFAGYGVFWLQNQIIGRRFKFVAAGAVVLVGTFWFSFKDPGNGSVFHAQNDAILGELFTRAGQHQNATMAFSRSIQVLSPAAEAGNPTIVRILGAAWYGQGVARLEAGDEIGAAAAFRDSARCPEMDIKLDALARLAEIYKDAGKTGLLAGVLNERLAADPGDFRTAIRYGEALFKMGKLVEAENAVQQALSSNTSARQVDVADGWYGLAMIQRSLGDTAKYATSLNKVIKLNPDHPRANWIRDQMKRSHGEAGTP
jgi:tetratricopeptide (TPR) repeat protein